MFESERTSIFERAWLCVGREQDVAHPGQWIRAPLTREGIVVVRGADLVLRAFYNVCRHRGVPLLEGSCGKTREIQCPYHGWSYELSGALREAPHAPTDLDRRSHALAPVRVDVWQGFVFVTEDSAGAPLADALAHAPPWLEEGTLTHAARVHLSEYEVAANWKLLAENFQESDHFTRVHPALEQLTPNRAARSVLADGSWLGGTMELADGTETVSMSGRRQGRPFVAPRAYQRQVSDAMLFPALLTSLQPDYFLTYRLQPLAPEKTHVVAETFMHPTLGAIAGDPRIVDVLSFWETVNREDKAICERQQLGMRSCGYTPTRYSTVEDGVHAFDCRVAKAYLA